MGVYLVSGYHDMAFIKVDSTSETKLTENACV